MNLKRVRELQTTPAGDHFTVLHEDQRIPITRRIREVSDRLAAL